MKKKLNLFIFILLILATVSEFICLFLRGYSELWLAVLVVSLEIWCLGFVSLFTKAHFLFLIATLLGLTGSILLIGFPSYIPFAALIFFGLSLIAEVSSFFLSKQRKE